MASKQPIKSPSMEGMDALSILSEDHKYVQSLFKEFTGNKENEDVQAKRELVKVICAELKIHAQIEEELFYPAAREAISDDELLDEAAVEHASAKDIMAKLSLMKPDNELYDAKVVVLGEYVNHHIEEEQNKLFPKLQEAEIDLYALGQKLLERKQQLIDELGLPQGETSDEEEDFLTDMSNTPSTPGKGTHSRHGHA